MPIHIYRIARWLYLRRIPIFPTLLKAINRIVWGVVLPPSAELGKGVLLGYQGLGTVIHRRAKIGDFVNIGSCVTIGGRAGHEIVPVIKSRVMIGSGAKVLGPVVIGEYASIGANAVVLEDVPAYGVAVGVPAKVVRINRPSDVPDYLSYKRDV